MAIKVIYIKQEHPLGTEDGITYTVFPVRPDEDEEGNHGK